MSEAEKAEQKRLEKERKRQEKELRRQAKLKAKTKKLIRVSSIYLKFVIYLLLYVLE